MYVCTKYICIYICACARCLNYFLHSLSDNAAIHARYGWDERYVYPICNECDKALLDVPYCIDVMRAYHPTSTRARCHDCCVPT